MEEDGAGDDRIVTFTSFDLFRFFFLRTPERMEGVLPEFLTPVEHTKKLTTLHNKYINR